MPKRERPDLRDAARDAMHFLQSATIAPDHIFNEPGWETELNNAFRKHARRLARALGEDEGEEE